MESRIEFVRGIFNLIFDIPYSNVEETKTFAGISQAELSGALRYWIDQLKGLFAEVVDIKEIHGLNEEGIDLTIDLLGEPKLRFGIQIKTYDDINDSQTTFASKVHAQISRSHKHGLSNLIIAFAGNLANSSQNQKVAGILSDIHQNTEDNYIIAVTPEILLTIFKAYKNHEYPLNFINLDIKSAILVSKMMSKALTNQFREANVKVQIKYKNDTPDDEGFKIEIRTKLNPEDYGKLDVMERLNDMKENLTFENIEEFKIYEKDKLIYSSPRDEKITFMRQPVEFSLTLQTISTDDSAVIKSLNDIPFITNNENGIRKSTVRDEKNPLRVEFIYDPKIRKVRLNLSMEHFRGNAVNLLESFIFWNSLSMAKQIKIIELPSNKVELIPIQQGGYLAINKTLFKVVESLALIQEKTGYILKLPKDLKTISPQELQKIKLLSESIKQGKLYRGNGNGTFSISRIHALQILDQFIKNGELNNFEIPIGLIQENILGVDINFGYGKLRSPKCKPIGDPKDLYDKFVTLNQDIVDLNLEFADSEIILEWFYRV